MYNISLWYELLLCCTAAVVHLYVTADIHIIYDKLNTKVRVL